MILLNSIKQKVWFCAGIGILGFLIATISTYYSNNQLTNNLGTLREVSFRTARTTSFIFAILMGASCFSVVP